jgi:chloride channel 3/4/5
MTDSSNTTGARRTSSWAPSIPSIHRRWSALSNAEQGQDAATVRAEQAIEEEIDEIKRYEVRRQ